MSDRADHLEERAQDEQIEDRARERRDDHTPVRLCPDSGTCHHECAEHYRGACWRVFNACPLSATGWDTWPSEIRGEHMHRMIESGHDPRSMALIVQDETDSIEAAECREAPLTAAPFGLWGEMLWAKATAAESLAGWAELTVRERRRWAQAERFLAHYARQEEMPGALRVEMAPGEPVQAFDRHIEAVMATLMGRLDAVHGEAWRRAWFGEEWLRETAERLLSAADAGF